MRRQIPRIVSGGIALLLLAALLGIWWFSDRLADDTHRNLLVGFVGGLIAALVTVGVGWVAWEQLSNVAQTTSADFLLRLKSDFFRPITRTLITLVANEWLRFVARDEHENAVDIPYFEVREDALNHARLPKEVKARLCLRRVYTAFDVDDLLLGPLDDVAMLWERGTLPLDMVRNMFGWYVEVALDDGDVKAYIEHQQHDEDPAIYAALGRLRNALRRN